MKRALIITAVVNATAAVVLIAILWTGTTILTGANEGDCEAVDLKYPDEYTTICNTAGDTLVIDYVAGEVVDTINE